MSSFSDLLNDHVERKGISIAELSRKCGLDRSTLFQYLRGRRPLQNQKHRDAIFKELRLTPSEREELMQEYEISIVGERCYLRRCRVKEILSGLVALEDPPGSASRLSSMYGSGRNGFEQEREKLLRGELVVKQMVYRLVAQAFTTGTRLDLLGQTDYDFLREVLLFPDWSDTQCQVTQIICMGSDVRNGTENLDRIPWILRCGITLQHYTPLYFYGTASERYGTMNLMPSLILTDTLALQISSDRKNAILHTDPEIVAFFRSEFEKMKSCCQVFMEHMDDLNRLISCYAEYVSVPNQNSWIEITSGLCSVTFWTPGLIARYINRAIPQCEELARQLGEYTQMLYAAKKQEGTTVIMNPAAVLDFIRTGVFREYPSVFFARPFSVRDRRELLERILQASREGWYQVRFMREEVFPLDTRWELGIQTGGKLLLQYCPGDRFQLFQFQEPDILDAFSDYLQSVCQSPDVCSTEEACAQIREWMTLYLGGTDAQNADEEGINSIGGGSAMTLPATSA